MAKNFNVGDVVKKRYGSKPMRILREEWGDKWYCEFLHNKNKTYTYDQELVIYDESPEEPMAETKTLYSFKKADGSVAYGSHIGTNSSNNYLIEEKGTGDIHVLSPKDVEEVLPYTFSASINGKDTHYVCQPDAVKKNDFLLYTNGSQPQIAVVTAVDTKNKTARAKFRGKRLVLEDI